MVEILIKRTTKKIKLPVYKTTGSAGMDIEANIENDIIINPGEKKLIPTGIFVAIPDNYEIQIRPRSGLAINNGISVLNTPGTIDSDYRGEIKVILINLGKEIFKIKNGERIAQIVLSPVVNAKFKEVNELPNSPRGRGGFGSTGS